MIFIWCNQYTVHVRLIKGQIGLEIKILGRKEFKKGLKPMKLDKCTDKKHVR